MNLIGEGKIKILWGFIVLIGAITTHLISGNTTESYPYLAVWGILVVAGLIITTRIPHGHRQREAWVGFVWIVLAAIGIALTYWVAEAVIEASFVTIPIVWMLLVGIGAILTGLISTEHYFMIPGVIVLIMAAITYLVLELHPYLFAVFGLAFGIPMIIVGLIER